MNVQASESLIEHKPSASLSDVAEQNLAWSLGNKLRVLIVVARSIAQTSIGDLKERHLHKN